MLIAVNSQAKDFHKTEEMINSILKEDGDSTVKNENAVSENKITTEETAEKEKPGEVKQAPIDITPPSPQTLPGQSETPEELKK